MTPLSSRLVLPVAAFLALSAGSASAQAVYVAGNTQAHKCFQHARMAADNMMSPIFAVETCTEALRWEQLSPADRSATYNNRGIVLMTMMAETAPALEDFTAAVAADPRIGESYVNRGTALVKEQRYQEAIEQFDESLNHNLDEPWKAYFNRALAREASDDVRGAYYDFMKALELKPDWELPKQELSRYSVRPANG